MIEYFKVKSHGGNYQVYYQDNPTSRKLPMMEFPNYLDAKFRAYLGNCRMNNAEKKFKAETAGVK